MASHMQTLYCEIWLPTQLSLKKVMRDTVAIRVQDESPKWTLSIICRINPKNKAKKNANLGLFMQKPPVSETSKGCRIESSPARSWSCQEDVRGGRISENSPSVNWIRGLLSTLPLLWDGAEPQEVWYPAQQHCFAGGSSAPSSTRSPFSTGQLGMGQYNRAAAKKRKRGLFSSFWLVKSLWQWSLQAIIQADNLWATWTFQTLTLGSFHKHTCRTGEEIALGLDGIDQYFRQQLLNCGKGECGAHWQTEDFHYCPVLSVSINPHPTLHEVTANFPIGINEIWTTGTAEC